MEIKFLKIAEKQLKELYKNEKKTALRIIDKIKELKNKENKNQDIKRLSGELDGFYRLRVGNYRVRYIIENEMILIVTIKHRKNAYE